jgi:hypothetical protein
MEKYKITTVHPFIVTTRLFNFFGSGYGKIFKPGKRLSDTARNEDSPMTKLSA